MTWAWSHTPEAYADARANLNTLPLATLQEIYSEWVSYLPDSEDADSEGFSIEAHTEFHNSPTTLDRETLIDAIWERAEEKQACTNGGWLAWVCPFGCHTVPFDRIPDSLHCPECGEEIWDRPEGSKLAKCWNMEAHEDGRTVAFDTLEIQSDREEG